MKKSLAWLFLSAAVMGCGRTAPIPTEGRELPRPKAPSYPLGLTGTASCAGATCHGRVEPVAGQEILQTEHTTWVLRDRHADAYRALFSERSQRIARNLGIEKAHEAAECLACHANPHSAGEKEDSLALADRSFGVGCESCHGGAAKWLHTHDKPAWKELSTAEKAKEGMTPLGNLQVRIEVCARCHVGAPPDPEGKTPARDVNHDLIAAGHPRLNFEYAAFALNMPAHWNTSARKRDEVENWAVGQLTTSKIALELLAYRAKSPARPDKPWPELAEYRCFACHHDLNLPSWRQEPGYYGKNLPGSVPWNDWYVLMPHTLASMPASGNRAIQLTLDELGRIMRVPYPSQDLVAQQAERCARLTADWLADYKAPPAKELRAALLTHKPPASWDQATQLYLGLAALTKPTDAQQQAELDAIYEKLGFPTQEERFDSPRGFRPDAVQGLFKKLSP